MILTDRQAAVKSAIDKVLAVLLIAATLPITLLASLWVMAASRGPVLFVQERVGKGEKRFKLYKFRTMHLGSDNHSLGSVTIRRDPRLFAGASLMRRFKIDELPQLLNVLNGTMSLIGPRPTLKEDYDRMTAEQRRRAEVNPGLTGLAQVNGSASLSWPRRIEYDLTYIREYSLWQDLQILLKTISAIATGEADLNPESGDEWNTASEIGQADPADRIYLSPPHMSPRDRDLLLEAFDSNWIAPLGPQIDAFENEFATKLGVAHAIALSSGTGSLHLALAAAGVGADDIVLTSTLTFAATANAIRYVGATPVFVDSDRRSWNMDPILLRKELEELILCGKKPAAVVVVNVCGQSADLEPIVTACRQHSVTVIEDAAESLGATYKGRPSGTLGDIGCFSFNGNKIITTSGGGMLVTENPVWAAKVRHLATQARDPALHYEHSQVGYNYRMSNLLAAIGRGQLSVLEDRVSRRRENFKFYSQALRDLPGIEFMPEATFGLASRWLTCLLLDPNIYSVSPADVCASLASDQIEARPMWKPMHLQPAYESYRSVGGEVAEDLFARGLCLPSGSSMKECDLARVAAALKSALLSKRRQLAA